MLPAWNLDLALAWLAYSIWQPPITCQSASELVRSIYWIARTNRRISLRSHFRKSRTSKPPRPPCPDLEKQKNASRGDSEAEVHPVLENAQRTKLIRSGLLRRRARWTSRSTFYASTPAIRLYAAENPSVSRKTNVPPGQQVYACRSLKDCWWHCPYLNAQ